MVTIKTGRPQVNDLIVEPIDWHGTVVKSQPNAKNGNLRVRVRRESGDKCFLMFQRDVVKVKREGGTDA